jgi:hypothetical protein
VVRFAKSLGWRLLMVNIHPMAGQKSWPPLVASVCFDVFVHKHRLKMTTGPEPTFIGGTGRHIDKLIR